MMHWILIHWFQNYVDFSTPTGRSDQKWGTLQQENKQTSKIIITNKYLKIYKKHILFKLQGEACEVPGTDLQAWPAEAIKSKVPCECVPTI